MKSAATPLQRGRELAAAFARIAATRMADLPLANRALQVAAVGFEPLDGGACGVLITPWCMNLMWLPLDDAQAAAAGQARRRRVGTSSFDFVGGHDDGFGGFEACSLFSPMSAFADQAAASATAAAVLQQLRQGAAAPARRGFLFGQRSRT